MQNPVVFETQSGNSYLHSPQMQQLLLLHPVMVHLLKLREQGTAPEEWFDSLATDTITLENGAVFSRDQVAYYVNKYTFLVAKGYFEAIDNAKRLGGRLTAQSVLYQLANCDQLTFEVTEACNLACEYCGYGKFYQSTGNRTRKTMDFSLAQTMLDYLVDHWNSNRNISHKKNIDISFYGGEPLLNFSLLQAIVTYAETIPLLHNFFTFSMTTNGTLLDKYMDFLVSHNFLLHISLDGNEFQNGYRVFANGTSSQSVVIENIEKIRAKYPDYFEQKVFFIAVLHNKNSVPQVMRYFMERYNKHVMIVELNTNRIAPEKEAEFWNTYRNFSESLAQAQNYCEIRRDFFQEFPEVREANSFLSAYSGFVYKSVEQLLHLDVQPEFIPTATCPPFGKKIFVTVNGKILPCERIGQDHSLGSVSAEAVNLDFEAIARQYNYYYDRLSYLCSVCYTNKSCGHCLFNLPQPETSAKNKKAQCPGCCDATHFSRYMGHHMSILEENPQIVPLFMKEVNII